MWTPSEQHCLNVNGCQRIDNQHGSDGIHGTQQGSRIVGPKRQPLPGAADVEGRADERLEARGIAGEPAEAPLFRTAKGKTKELTANGMKGKNVLRMVKRRFKAAGLPKDLTCHTFRATTITDLLDSGVNPDDVQNLAGHVDPRTARPYDRRTRDVTRNIVERISI